MRQLLTVTWAALILEEWQVDTDDVSRYVHPPGQQWVSTENVTANSLDKAVV